MLSLDKEYETVNGETVELRHVIGGVKHLNPIFVGVYWDGARVPRQYGWQAGQLSRALNIRKARSA